MHLVHNVYEGNNTRNWWLLKTKALYEPKIGNNTNGSLVESRPFLLMEETLTTQHVDSNCLFFHMGKINWPCLAISISKVLLLVYLWEVV